MLQRLLPLLTLLCLLPGGSIQLPSNVRHLKSKMDRLEKFLARSLTTDGSTSLLDVDLDAIKQKAQYKRLDPVAFSSYRSNGQSSISSGYILKFSSVHVNTGSHYNPTNGVFVAPLNGYYLFHWDLVVGDDTVTALMINGTRKCRSYAAEGSSVGTGSSTVIMEVHKDQHVWLEVNSGGGYLYGGYTSTLSGLLLHRL